jgi:hypothetical protein
MANPFNFCATCYSANSYQQLGGYTASRLINPDKWFHWRLLSIVDYVYFIDKPLFQYRWHDNNQTAIQQKSGFLKYHIDEYRSLVEITPAMLQKAGVVKEDIEKWFIENDVYRHGIAELGKGYWLKSLRIFFMGMATYPSLMVKKIYFTLYILLLLLGPFGILLSRFLVKYRKK